MEQTIQQLRFYRAFRMNECMRAILIKTRLSIRHLLVQSQNGSAMCRRNSSTTPYAIFSCIIAVTKLERGHL